MPTAILTTTLGAGCLSAISNLLAQSIKCRREHRPLVVNVRSVLIFVAFTLLSCPPNILWQDFLEYKFPGQTAAGTLHTPNTLHKLLFDQTLGAFVNTMAFVAGMAALKGKSWTNIKRDVERDLFELMINSWKLWPAVSLFNFAFVPVYRRVIVGNVVGLFWGIYLSLYAALD